MCANPARALLRTRTLLGPIRTLAGPPLYVIEPFIGRGKGWPNAEGTAVLGADEQLTRQG